MKTLRTSFIVLALLLLALMPVMANGAKEALAKEEVQPAATEATVATPVQETPAASASGLSYPDYAVINKDDLFSAFNFAYGYYITGQLVDQGVSFNSAYYHRGLYDGYFYGEKESLVEPGDMQDLIQEYVDTFYSQGMSEPCGDIFSMEELLALEAPTTLVDKFSYAYAYMNIVQLYLYNGLDILVEDFMQGSVAAMHFLEPVEMTFQEMQDAIDNYAAMLDEEYAEYQNQVAENNLDYANQFMEANKTAEGVRVVNDYVLVQTVTEPNPAAPSPTADNSVIVNYALYLLDGSQIDAGEEVTFDLGSLIPGFTEGVTNMKVGEEALIYIHPDHGYGAQDLGTIGPNSLLIFDVVLLNIL